MAASIGLPNYSTTISGGGADIAISAALLLVQINTTNAAVDETFVINAAGDTQVLSLPRGPFLRLSGFLSLAITFGDSSVSAPFSLSGNFAFEQITLPDPNPGDTIPAPKAVRIAASDVQVNVLGVQLKDGLGGFVFLPEGIAGQLRVTLKAGDPGVATLGGDICRSTPPARR